MARTTRTLRTDLPNDVWDRLAAEAASKGLPLGRHVRNLIVARDKRRNDGAQRGVQPSPDRTDTGRDAG